MSKQVALVALSAASVKLCRLLVVGFVGALRSMWLVFFRNAPPLGWLVFFLQKMPPLVGWWFSFKRCPPRLVGDFFSVRYFHWPAVGRRFVFVRCFPWPVVGFFFKGPPPWLAAGWRGKVNRQAWLAALHSCTQLSNLRTAWQSLARMAAG